MGGGTLSHIKVAQMYEAGLDDTEETESKAKPATIEASLTIYERLLKPDEELRAIMLGIAKGGKAENPFEVISFW